MSPTTTSHRSNPPSKRVIRYPRGATDEVLKIWVPLALPVPDCAALGKMRTWGANDLDQRKTCSPNCRDSLRSRWSPEIRYAHQLGLPAMERPPQSALAKPVAHISLTYPYYCPWHAAIFQADSVPISEVKLVSGGKKCTTDLRSRAVRVIQSGKSLEFDSEKTTVRR